jgi:2'-5'-oligoadenylate synthetase
VAAVRSVPYTRAPCFSLPFSSQCKEKLGKPLPPQYALELLTVYAWESGSRDCEFNTAQGFRTVLELVTKYKWLRIYWTVYYDFRKTKVSEYLHKMLQKVR